MGKHRIDRATFLRGALAAGASAAVATVAPSPVVAAGLATLTDRDGHEMPYAWRPAADPPNARTLVWLHAHGANAAPERVGSRNWNVLVPLDRYGPEGQGSWWLGEGGDFFVLALLHRLIRAVRRRIGSDQGLYFAGSSMGGYGSILHGMLLGARAVYANAPQTRLGDPALLGPTASPYANVAGMVAGSDGRALPWFWVDARRFDERSDFAGQVEPFLRACAASGASVGGEVLPVAGHHTTRSFAQVIGLFDGYRATIESW